MRVYDRIMRKKGIGFPASAYSTSTESDLRALIAHRTSVMAKAVRLDVQNVADYLYAGTDQENWEWGKDFPNLAPPYETMWMEFRLPQVMRSKDLGVYNTRMRPLRIGVLLSADHAFTEDKQFGGWYVQGSIFADTESQVYPQMIGELKYLIDPDGAMVSAPYDPGVPGVDIKVAPEHIDEDGQAVFGPFGIHSFLYSPALAISFLHCKNVVVEDARPEGTRQQQRARQRDGIREAQFKTLVIEPMKQVLRTEGGIEQHGLKKAMHICRGHFATYSEDKPLFGKYSGTFWRPAHVRGSAEAGTVYKDYKVKPPK